MCKLTPKANAEHQLKSLGHLHRHSAAPFGLATKWFGLQDASMSIPEAAGHYLRTPLFVYKAATALIYEETIFKQKGGRKHQHTHLFIIRYTRPLTLAWLRGETEAEGCNGRQVGEKEEIVRQKQWGWTVS